MKPKTVDLLVGAFVLVGLTIVLFGIFTLRGGWPGGKVTYHARYGNVGTLVEGSPVKYQGFLVGRVQELKIDPEQPARIRVSVSIDKDTPVTTATVAQIRKADLLGDMHVELVTVGSTHGQLPGDFLNPGDFLLVQEPFDLDRALQTANDSIALLHDLIAMVMARAEVLLDSLEQSLSDAGELVAGENKLRIEKTLDELARSSQLLRELIDENDERVTALVDTAAGTTERLSGLAREIEDAVAELRPELKGVVSSVRGTVDQAGGLIETVDGSVSQLDVQQVNDLIENLELTSRHLVELTGAIKDRPYLLVRPEKHDRKKEKQ